eukprot:comp17524_c1_seq1/m.17071 comp17524_c1_seq1/g.17071  ORF comp17524_c1_seq1/g.17071 comp17524_c1_seq1/m.17071 type:complete len:283 (-) comp17524_c1_seq1:374-1222(-)
MPEPLYLADTAVAPRVKVRPVVLFAIADHYARREEGQHRVIGTLLGVARDGEVEIRNCFPVPHNETADQVAMNMEFQRTMFELHQKVNQKEAIVGWYATGTEITEHSVLIHEFYGREADNPIHLTFNCDVTKGAFGFQAYVSSPLGIANRSPGTVFVPVQAELAYSEAERTGVDLLQRSKEAPNGTMPILTEMDHLESAVDRLANMLDAAHTYVKKVVEGEQEGDKNVGRQLLSLVQTVPEVDGAILDRLFNNNLQDLLTVVYLTNLTRTQLKLSERLYNVL